MLTICGQTGGVGVHIVQDVPRTPSKTRPRPPAGPRERRERKPVPIYFLEDWRVYFGKSFRDMQEITGIDIGTLKRSEDRAAGKPDLKNKTKGVDTSVVHAYRDAFGMKTIEQLQRRPTDPPSDAERFAEVPPEWRDDLMRMISRITKQ